MSSLESGPFSTNTHAGDAGRCFGGHLSSVSRWAGPLGYALLAAIAMLGLTASAASTQAAEASLLVTDFAAARGAEAAR
jgi:hypothetical protein